MFGCNKQFVCIKIIDSNVKKFSYTDFLLTSSGLFLVITLLVLVTSEENQMSFKVDEHPVYAHVTNLMFNM